MRVHFICGGRALQVFRAYQQAVMETSRLLSSPVQEVPDAVKKLQQRLSDSEAALARLRRASAQVQLTDALQAVQPGQHGWRVLAHTVEEADMELLSQLAGDLVQASCVAVLLHGTVAGRDTVFAGSPQGSVDMVALLREVGLRGGGRPDLHRQSVPVMARHLHAARFHSNAWRKGKVHDEAIHIHQFALYPPRPQWFYRRWPACRWPHGQGLPALT